MLGILCMQEIRVFFADTKLSVSSQFGEKEILAFKI